MSNSTTQLAVHARFVDAELGATRLRQFIAAMLPLAIAYDLLFVATSFAWRSPALVLGGVVSVTVYVVALVWARRELSRNEIARAALITGGALLVMIALGAVFLHFQFAALVLIAIAAVIVVLPHITRRALLAFACAAMAVIIEIVVLDAMMAPLFTQPPSWFQQLILTTSLTAAAILVILMLASDHERMRRLVSTSIASAADAHRAREATETFLVAAAHQLRTPVSTVLLQCETALVGGELEQKTRVRVERLVRQATRLQQVVDSMLDVSRASAGTLQLERRPADLAAIVREVASRYARAAAEIGVVIDVDAPVALPLECDAQRVALVTSHLIDNAIKFGGRTPPRVTLREDGGDVVLSVSDAGPGMTPDVRERCFDRSSSGSRADGSLGVGLWLSRKLARAMGGDVTRDDGWKPGTKLTVRIPRSTA